MKRLYRFTPEADLLCELFMALRGAVQTSLWSNVRAQQLTPGRAVDDHSSSGLVGASYQSSNIRPFEWCDASTAMLPSGNPVRVFAIQASNRAHGKRAHEVKNPIGRGVVGSNVRTDDPSSH